MRKFLIEYRWLLVTGCLLFLTVSGIYFFSFRHYGPSGDSKDWGSFGSYLGGVLAPILSFTSIVLIIYSLKQQRTVADRQKFETNFFKLIELHKNEIYNLAIKKKDLHLYENYSHMTEVIKSYEVLDELVENEEKNLSEYFYIQAYKSNHTENLHVFNYRALNNHFIQTRDYLNSIVFSIINILKLIREAEISAEEKDFYRRVLKSKLRDSEKFFLVVFYKQMQNSIKEYITKEEVMELAGRKDWIIKPIHLTDEFPFCIPGICLGNSFDLDIPTTSYKLPLQEFLKKDFFYLIKSLNLDIKCIKASVKINDDVEKIFEIPDTDIEYKNRIWHFNFRSFFEKYFRIGEAKQPVTFVFFANDYLDKNKFFNLTVKIHIQLKNDTYILTDKLTIQIHTNGDIYILIHSNKNTAWKENWRMWSFREDVPNKSILMG